jgi:hypothetical protein
VPTPGRVKVTAYGEKNLYFISRAKTIVKQVAEQGSQPDGAPNPPLEPFRNLMVRLPEAADPPCLMFQNSNVVSVQKLFHFWMGAI